VTQRLVERKTELEKKYGVQNIQNTVSSFPVKTKMPKMKAMRKTRVMQK